MVLDQKTRYFEKDANHRYDYHYCIAGNKACFNCKRVFSNWYNSDFKPVRGSELCCICGDELTHVGTKFEAPKKSNVKEWKRLEKYWNQDASINEPLIEKWLPIDKEGGYATHVDRNGKGWRVDLVSNKKNIIKRMELEQKVCRNTGKRWVPPVELVHINKHMHETRPIPIEPMGFKNTTNKLLWYSNELYFDY